MEPDVSVVVRAHNAQKTLSRAIGRALEQKGVSVEVVVVDDASTDSTALVAAEASIADPASVRVVTHVGKLGRLESYRSGLKASRGRWVLFCDADDELVEGALAKLCDAAQNAAADILVPSIEIRGTVAPVADDGEPPSPDATGDLSAARLEADDLFDDRATGSASQVVSPVMQTVEADAVVNALFVDKTVPVQVRGRLFSADVVRHAFAEIEIGSVASHDEAVASFMTAVMAARLAVRPDLRSVAIARDVEPDPLPVADFEAICANRHTAEVVAGYLNRSEQWERFYGAWEGLALMMAGEAVSRFPDHVAPEDWPAAADALLGRWGAPYVAAAVAENPDVDLARFSVAVSCATGLAVPPSRPRNPCLVVHGGDDVARVKRLMDALSARRCPCKLLCDSEGPVPQGLDGTRMLPAPHHVLDRARALMAALGEMESDCVVMLAGNESNAYDELVARSLSLPVAVVATEAVEGTPGYRRLASQVALATVVVPHDGVDAELWGLGGARMSSADGLVSTMSLGTAARTDIDARQLACRLLRLVRGFEDEADRLKEACAHAIDRHDRMETQVAGLLGRVADLERRLEAALAENDELTASLDEISSHPIRKGILGRSSRHGS